MKNERRKYMNNSKQDILNNLIKEPFINQRILAAQTGHSLGIVNRSIKEQISEGYLDEEIRPTEKTLREAKEKAPKNAIILAAGFGMRMVPINTETPKGLLEIKGERLIERTIRQLHEVGITEIYVVVGFMKEQYEYLIDEYGVELIVAPDYVSKNNLHSLKTAAAHLSNSYIIPCSFCTTSSCFRFTRTVLSSSTRSLTIYQERQNDCDGPCCTCCRCRRNQYL